MPFVFFAEKRVGKKEKRKEVKLILYFLLSSNYNNDTCRNQKRYT
jgi:hypothetical protein